MVSMIKGTRWGVGCGVALWAGMALLGAAIFILSGCATLETRAQQAATAVCQRAPAIRAVGWLQRVARSTRAQPCPRARESSSRPIFDRPCRLRCLDSSSLRRISARSGSVSVCEVVAATGASASFGLT